MMGVKTCRLVRTFRSMALLAWLIYLVGPAAAQPDQPADCPLPGPIARQEFLNKVSDDSDLHLLNLINKCGIAFPVDEQIIQIVQQRNAPPLPQTLNKLRSLMAQKRVIISLFKYIAVSGCPDLSAQYKTFKEMLKWKRDILISNYNDARHSYLKNLSLQETGIEYNEYQQFVDQMKRPDVLQVMYGLCESDAKGVFIKSQVFLGDLASPLPEALITIDIRNDTTEYSHNLDLHSLLILYALAQDAKNDSEDKELHLVTRGYLDRARNIAASLQNTEHAKQAEHVLAAILKIYEELGITVAAPDQLPPPPGR